MRGVIARDYTENTESGKFPNNRIKFQRGEFSITNLDESGNESWTKLENKYRNSSVGLICFKRWQSIGGSADE